MTLILINKGETMKRHLVNRLQKQEKIAIIYETIAYHLFERNAKNRNERKYRAHISALAESIEQNGMRNPMRVKPDGTILDGHCRFAAAQLVNAPVKYFIDQNEVSVYQAAYSHALTRNWSKTDFTEVYSQRKPAYKKLVDLSKEFSLHPAQIYILATNASWSTAETRKEYERGEFQFTSSMEASVRCKVDKIRELSEVRNGLFKTPILAQKPLQVVSKMLEVPGYNHKQMIKNLARQHEGTLVTFNKLSDAARVLQEIHNSTRKGSKINLIGYFL